MSARMRSFRLRLAQLVAPVGADVHDPDESECPHMLAILEAVEAYDLLHQWGRIWLDVSDDVTDAEHADLIGRTTDLDGGTVYQILGPGERHLADLRRRFGWTIADLAYAVRAAR